MVRTSLAVLIILLIGLPHVGHYGIASDERVETLAVFWNLEAARDGTPIPFPQKYYGAIYHVGAEIVFQAVTILRTGRPAATPSDKDFTRAAFRDRAEVKHVVTFVGSAVAYLAVAGIVGALAGARHAWIGPVVLALFPRFWGHSFFNPKDVPFAIALTLGTLVGSKLVARFLSVADDVAKPGIHRLTGGTLVFGVLVGLITGTRIAGAVLLAFVGLAHATVHLGQGHSFRTLVRYWPFYILMTAGWLATVVAIHPAAWGDPLAWLIDATRLMSQFQWEGSNLFAGRYIPAAHVPWYYLPVWLMITTPALLQVMAAVGLLMVVRRYKTLSGHQQACAMMLLLQLGFIPAVAVLRHSTIYDAMRQFLFLLPAMAALAATAVGWTLDWADRTRFQLMVPMAFIVLAAPVVADMFALHPYEYVYFNRAYGGLQQAAGRFDTDYYGLSMREAMEWVNQQAEPGAQVVSTNPYRSAETFARPGMAVTHISEFKPSQGSSVVYYIAAPRYDFHDRFPDCPVVFRVVRQGVALAIVRRCERA
ncbi:MAG: hypothetical protein AB7H81_07330 [Vicinamibacterales bacterium]